MPAPYPVSSPPQPAPIGAGTYTTWPGGVDPTARLFNTDNTKIPCVGTWAGAGGRRGSRKASRKNRKASRKNRKASRKNRRC